MERSKYFRSPEMHIAQQSRRERLRIQQHPHDPAGQEDIHDHLYTSNDEIADQFVHLQRLRYNENLGYNTPTTTVFSSEMVSFSTAARSQTCNKIISCDPQNFNTWKSTGSHNQTRDQFSSASGLVGHPNPTMIIGDLSDPSLKTTNNIIPSYILNHPANSYDANQHVMRFSLSGLCNEIPSPRISHKHYTRDVPFINCPSINQTVAYDHSGTASLTHENCREPCQFSWASASNVVGMVPDYAQQFNAVNAQGLSLSLSTMPLTKQNQCRMDEKLTPNHSMLAEKSSAAGPLGPFTGYETILKTSKYLNPAQELLHELCSCEISHDIIGDRNSPPLFDCSSNEKTQEAEAAGSRSSSTNDSCRPDYLQKKEKLLYMQEEVCRRYVHYHQQMQMVVSSFESVAGLTSATPYISVALKAISKLFHSIRNAISDHLKSVKKALGEDVSSPTTGASSSKCDTTTSSMFKLIDNPYRKHPKPAAINNLGLFEPQQHVWRPQRGLPERAVAILRTWLFDHFLHPYPTDSDKHMLASQTGLTRNQVSNWFINARVRIWKPMVEEIHSLETKATAEAGSNVGKNDKNTAPDDGSCSNGSQQQLVNTNQTTGLSGSKQVEFPGYSASGYPGNPVSTAQAWNPEGSIVDFVPYLNGGMDLGGAVSLTLGLRQNGQQPPQHLLHGSQLRRHCGDQIVYDFVG